MKNKNLLKELYKEKPDGSNIAGFFMPAINFTLDTNQPIIKEDRVCVLENLLTDDDLIKLIALFNQSPNLEPVSVQGLKTLDEVGIGSYRTTMFSPELALMFSEKITDWNHQIICDEHSRTDVQDGTWKLLGFSPMFRFMRYKLAGKHNVHYDAGYEYSETIHTLQSVVIYLTTNPLTGATRFIDDNQDSLKQVDRNNSDWSIEAKDSEVIASYSPKELNAITFKHREAHDVEEFKGDGGERMIIRADLIYERI